ncbi:MAG: DUF2892 domain-containing protein [Acidobacteria bacterium]|nr:MAG: DUF2892 domain-containing protein [Acidobacteriota bacterium]
MNYMNLSNLDRAVRVVAGLLMLGAAWTGIAMGIWKAGLEIFGWVPLVTGLLGWCPIYALLGIRSRKPEP